MKQSIRVGLCGFGFMGKTHLYALSNLPYFYDLPYRAEVIGVHGAPGDGRRCRGSLRHPPGVCL